MRNDPKVMVSLKLFVISFVHSQGKTESLRAERKGNRCGSDTCNRRKYKSPSFWEHLFSNWIAARGEQVTKRCVCSGDLGMEGVPTHCLLHCRLGLRDSQPVVTFHYNCSAFSFSMVRLHLLS